MVKHKTASRGSTRKLPAVALAFGLLDKCWASVWLELRAQAHLDAAAQGCLLPRYDDAAGWGVRRSTTSHVTLWLRGFFASEAVGASSLKPTVLSWAAKYGVDKAARKVLGYHVDGEDKMVNLYSRDAYATPLRALRAVYADIVKGRFVPDATRSGMFAQDSCSSSSSSSSSDSPPVAADAGDLDTNSISDLVLNKSSGIFHRFNEMGDLTCGRSFPLAFEFLDCHPPANVGRPCVRCFRKV